MEKNVFLIKKVFFVFMDIYILFINKCFFNVLFDILFI